MTIVAIPNVSIGRDAAVRELSDAIESTGAVVLDTHSDSVHGRTVFTVADPNGPPIDAMVALARATLRLDLKAHLGVHPRLGMLDVCPFVTHDEGMEGAIDAARSAGRMIAESAGIPVYLYGAASARARTFSLPDLRRGGLGELARRASSGLPPDFGAANFDESTGVVCVGARNTLIAFNVWLRCRAGEVESIVSLVRESSGGPPGLRALGFAIDAEVSQVSMNLTRPDVTGIEAAFGAVAGEAEKQRLAIIATELVGLVPARFMPAEDAQATRLLMKPGRSLETALAYAGLI